MRGAWTLALGLLLAVGVAYAVTSQKEKRRDYRGVCWLLFYDRGIAEELKLSPRDLEKAQHVANEVTDRYRDKLDKARAAAAKDGSKDSPAKGVSKEWTAAVTEAARETDKALAAVLSPAQMKRLEQVHKQAYFYSTLLDAENAEVLKLTQDQRTKLSGLAKRGGPGMSPAEEKEWVDSGLAALSPDQKKAWELIVGPRYTFRR